MLGLLAMLTVAHIMLTSVRARRRDLAVLRSLGADQGFVTRAVHWQATLFTIVPIVVAVPAGLIAGRIVFAAFADSMGALNDAALPAAIVGVAIVALVLVANVVATVPARRACRQHPAAVLQAE